MSETSFGEPRRRGFADKVLAQGRPGRFDRPASRPLPAGAKRFGFVAVDSGRQEVFVHEATLQQSGVSNLSEGQRVEMAVAEGRNGLEAVSISRR